MPIDNGVVVLAENVPETMRFSAMSLNEVTRKDPDTGFIATVNKLSAQVTELNGVKVMTIFETLAEKLIAQLRPYMQDLDIEARRFTITRTGRGYLTEFTVQVS